MRHKLIRKGKLLLPFLIPLLITIFIVIALYSGMENSNNTVKHKAESYSQMYETVQDNSITIKTDTAKKILEEKKKFEKKEEKKKPKTEENNDRKPDKNDNQNNNNPDDSDEDTYDDDTSYEENNDDDDDVIFVDDGGEDSDDTEDGDSEEDGDNETVYFLTTIRDGETVSAYQYEFDIIHIQDNLSVESEKVYVNGEESPNFTGKIILKDGENSVKVSVTYKSSSGKIIETEKTYTIYVDSERMYITTDLESQTVSEPYIEFEAYAKKGSRDANLEVAINDQVVQGTDGSYRVSLEEGENFIKLTASLKGEKISQEYTVNFDPGDEFKVYTDLENKTVNEEKISFTAKILNGSKKARLQVIANGEELTGEDDRYTANLNKGNNTIRIKGTDAGGKTISKIYTIKYVPLATPETEPKLVSINVSDGKEIEGETFNLKLKAEDYEGNKIYYNGITVKLNGKKIQYRWSGDVITYTLKLLTGENKLYIKVTDGDGRFKEFNYNLNCTYIADGTPIGKVTVNVDARVLHLGTILSASNVELCYGENTADIIVKTLAAKGFSYSSTGTPKKGFYLASIKRNGITNGWSIDQALIDEIEEDGLTLNIDPETDKYIYDRNSLGQLDFCQGSGWMYNINGSYSNYGLSDYIPKDGDVINIRYTLSYGKDLGAYSSSGGSHGIKDKYNNTY